MIRFFNAKVAGLNNYRWQLSAITGGRFAQLCVAGLSNNTQVPSK